MSITRSLGRAVALVAFAASTGSAQIVANGPINGLGTFRDLGTGLTWLRLDNFFGKTPNEMVSVANAAGFKVADFTTVQTLWTSLPLGGGEWASYKSILGDAPNRELYWGLIDTGSQNEQGWGYAYSDESSWTSYLAGFLDWNSLANGGYYPDEEDMNLWAYQSSDVDVPEPSSVALVGIGLAAMGIVARRRRQ